MDYKKAYEEALERAKQGLPIDEVFPEMKENEDERVRKWLIEEIKATHDYDSPTSRKCVDDALAYLERQKEQKDYRKLYENIAQSKWFKKAHVGKSLGEEFEQKERKPLSTEETELNSIAFLEQLGYTCIPPGKEQESEIGNSEKPNNHEGDNETDVQKAYREGKNAGRCEVFEHPEEYGLQRPSEWSEEDIKKIRSEEYTKGFNDAAFGGKLKEWSEEDEKMLEQAIKCVNNSGKLEVSTEEIEDWLISLPEKFSPQLKQEWSEEDENKLHQVMEVLLADKTIVLRENPHCKALHKAYDELLDWLKSLRPQSHWKPSEEQIRPLEYAIEYFKKKKNDTTYLESLYDDLKKL